MSTSDLWPLSYHLCGCTLLGATPEEALGALPLSIRLAVLKIAAEQAPERFTCAFYPPTQLNYEAGRHQTYRYWQAESDVLLERLAQLDVERIPRFSAPDAYFQYYHLESADDPDNDEHWAEREFIRRVFVPLCGLDGLSYLKPQVPFQDSQGIERRIDFVLEGERRYAVEIEGRTYHDGADRFNREKARQRELPLAGFQYFPISWNDVEQGKAEPALRHIIEQDALLRPLLEPTVEVDLLSLAWLLNALPNRYQDAQRIALTVLARANEQGLSQIAVAEIDCGMPILTLSLIDTLGLVERVADFYGFPITLPKLNIHLITPRNRVVQEQLFRLILQTDRDPHERLDLPRTTIDFTIADALPADFPEKALIVAEADRQATEARTFTFDHLADWGRYFTAGWINPPERSPAPIGLERPTLDYFARRYFQVPELKPQQIELLKRTLRGQDAIGILPTGFGKSLVFQLYALLTPRVTLVISPLKALIRDQVDALRRLGWTCVDYTLSTDTTDERKRKLDELFHHLSYRLFYIAPERLQIKTFTDELRDTLHDTPLGALVIDEAHCVSEWGHDFRPAYLQIPRLRQILEDGAKRRVPLLALTATASPLVRADMQDTLGLGPETLLQSASSDRRNLSLSVHPVPVGGAKSKILKHLLTNDLPRALGLENSYSFFEDTDRDRYPNAGIVFAMYADPHGKTTFEEGTPQIAATLCKTMGLSQIQVQTHASRVPKVCPHCGSHDYWKAAAKEAAQARLGSNALKCRNCDHVFIQPQRIANWDTALQQRHQDFQKDRFPLLVATKGFGMGIDKRNVSFVVHHAFASGLEGYYQEAGRAGRANQRAHVALLYVSPTDACIRDRIDLGEMPLCITDPDSFKYRKCPDPYNLKVLCDFSHQARFIQDSYPGVEADCKTTYGVYNWLKEGRPLASQDGFTPPRCSGDDVKDTPDIDSKQTVYQLALYRLQQLGIVRDYTIQYFGRKDKWRFEVEFNTHWSPQSLLDHVMRFLERSRRPDSDDVAEPMQVLTALAAQCGSPPWAAEHCRTEEALLKKAIGTLLRRVYARVRTMRLQMLRNELDYVRAAEGTCRRVTLLNLFNDKLVAPDYRCEFCDICVPDLNFDQAQATDAVGNVDLEELLLRLNDLLATAKPEPARLHDFIRQVEDRGVLLGTLARATRHLEGDPASLSALYLAGALSWRIPARQNQALGYFRAGFQQGHQQGVTQDILLGLFYRTGAEIDPEEAVRWLNGIGSRLAPNDFLTWVQSQELLLGCDSAAYRVLSAIAKVRALGCLKGPLRELNALAISLSNKRSKRPRRMLSLKKRLDQ